MGAFLCLQEITEGGSVILGNLGILEVPPVCELRGLSMQLNSAGLCATADSPAACLVSKPATSTVTIVDARLVCKNCAAVQNT